MEEAAERGPGVTHAHHRGRHGPRPDGRAREKLAGTRPLAAQTFTVSHVRRHRPGATTATTSAKAVPHANTCARGLGFPFLFLFHFFGRGIKKWAKFLTKVGKAEPREVTHGSESKAQDTASRSF